MKLSKRPRAGKRGLFIAKNISNHQDKINQIIDLKPLVFP
jgi:hypothetical protein